jgi:hypothetical protein
MTHFRHLSDSARREPVRTTLKFQKELNLKARTSRAPRFLMGSDLTLSDATISAAGRE